MVAWVARVFDLFMSFGDYLLVMCVSWDTSKEMDLWRESVWVPLCWETWNWNNCL